MGQHKYNPTAIAAAKGELPPKPKPIGKRQSERILRMMMLAEMERQAPGLLALVSKIYKPL